MGQVTVGAGSSVWYHCVLRGDTNFIRIGARSNIQDGTIVHVNRAAEAAIIGDDVTVGHACIIHACTLEDRAFVGMGATADWGTPQQFSEFVQAETNKFGEIIKREGLQMDAG